MELTNENYYSAEADKEYMSVSQYKSFAGALGMKGCEFQAMQKLDGKYAEEKGTPLLVGGYVDAWVEGTLDEFKMNNLDSLYTKTSIKAYNKSGNIDDLVLSADFVQADSIIERIKKDEMMKYYLGIEPYTSKKQTIMTGEIEGIPWKIKTDSLLPDTIVDLKVMANISKSTWSEDSGEFLNFILYWGYDIQGAVYQEIVRQNTGERLPFVIAAVTKEKPEPDIELIEIDQVFLDDALKRVKANIPRIIEVKNGAEPIRCGKCPCCRQNKVLLEPIPLSVFRDRQKG